MKKYLFAAFIASLGAAQAQDIAVPDAYRALLRAQYAARTPSPPLDPAEAQRIYDAYLAARSTTASKTSSNSGQEAGMAPR
jgi:hypothetical protein